MKTVLKLNHSDLEEFHGTILGKNNEMWYEIRVNTFHDQDPYFIVHDSYWLEDSSKIARISFLRPVYFSCENSSNLWFLNNDEINVMIQYLQQISFDRVSRWQDMMSHWNQEMLFYTASKKAQKFHSYEEAFVNGCFNTKKNLSNTLYLHPDTSISDYTKLN